MNWIVHKFGGSSLADGERIAQVADLLLKREEPAQVIVVSAMKGVTDRLIGLTQQAATGQQAWIEALAALRQEHLDVATRLAGLDHPVHKELEIHFGQLDELLRSLALMGSVPAELSELISGLGEVSPARLSELVSR